MTSRRRLPPTAPSDLWDRPEMARALAERDMGSVVRIFRRWTGASQTDISGLVDMPQSHISDLERGRRQITALEVFERFAEGLSIPRHRLGLAEPTDDQPPQPADAEDEGDADGRQPPLTTEEAVRASARDAAGFIYEAGQDDHDPVVLEQLQADTSRLALQYSTSAPTDVLGEVRALRLRLLRTLNELQRADKAKDLYLIAGQLSGILAYVDLDLGYPDEAMTNSRMAWLCGEFAGHNGLRAWVRGTQSLIARFQGRYDEAYDLARSGCRTRRKERQPLAWPLARRSAWRNSGTPMGRMRPSTAPTMRSTPRPRKMRWEGCSPSHGQSVTTTPVAASSGSRGLRMRRPLRRQPRRPSSCGRQHPWRSDHSLTSCSRMSTWLPPG